MNAPMPDHDSRAYVAPVPTESTIEARAAKDLREAVQLLREDLARSYPIRAQYDMASTTIDRLDSVLAAHPAEPASQPWLMIHHIREVRNAGYLVSLPGVTPVQVEITDAAVARATRKYLDTRFSGDHLPATDVRLKGMRAALEAAAPLLGPRPLLDREAVLQVLRANLTVNEYNEPSATGTVAAVDALMEMARPLPTVEELAAAFNNEGAYCGDCDFEGGLSCPDCKRVCEGYGKAILALLNGETNA